MTVHATLPAERTPLTLDALRNRIIRLKDLLMAADMISGPMMHDGGGPICAILEVSLKEARTLDAMIDEMCDLEAAA